MEKAVQRFKISINDVKLKENLKLCTEEK